MNRILIFVLQIVLLTSHAFGAPISPEDNQDLPVSSEDRRTVSNIVWSCLATIFTCTWLAIHPNVPGRNTTTKGAISCSIERARLMIIAILAPEIIVGWAAEQFMVAWRVRHGEKISIASIIHAWREKTNKSKPTLSHGFFLSMGGFYYTDMPTSVYEDLLECTTDSDTPLLSDSSLETENIKGVLVDVRALESEPRLARTLAAISAETIEDKSKRDALSKIISILQISWFMMQCLARSVQHLPITLLEMAALAFAGLSIMTYCLWWHKPLNVNYHISLDPLNSSEFMRTLATKSHKESASPMASSADFSIGGVKDALVWVYNVARTFIFAPIEGRNNIGDGALLLSSGCPEQTLIPFVIGVCVGSLFGAFHCMAWSFYFPSHTEMLLWRFSSVSVMIGLLAAVVVIFIVEGYCPKWISKLPRLLPYWLMGDSVWELCFTALFFGGILAYIVGRIILIVLAFTQLRSLPQLAFHTVQWTAYIPHI